MADTRSDGTSTAAYSRNTVQREALLRALSTSDRFRTAQAIYSELRSNGERIGLTTVYRHLQRLAEEGALHAVQMADRQTAYRLCGETRHHHLVCTSCGAGVELHDAEMDRWAQAEGARWDYSDVYHRVEVFGLCPACRNRDRSK